MLEIEKISFAYPGHPPALKNESLAVGEGEFIGLAGRNGSGKTTLTRIMVALAKPISGQVTLDGKATKNCGPDVMARAIGYVFQNPDRQIFRDTVAQEVAFGPEQLGWSEIERQDAVAAALGMTGLEPGDGSPETWAVHAPALPAGWEAIEIDLLWLHGDPWRLRAAPGMTRAELVRL